MSYFQRLSATMLSFLVLAGSLAPLTAKAAIPSTNTLIKGNNSPAVYWYASNGKRYAFPNIQIFWSWFPTSEFKNIRTLSDQELASIQLGGNVMYRPGYKLIKTQSSEKVYAVSRYGVVRWIKTEQVARDLYGWNWTTKIEDIADSLFIEYINGSEINSTWDYNVSQEYNGVSTPSDSLRENYNNYGYNYNYNYNQNNNYSSSNNGLSISVNNTSPRENDYVNVNISYTGSYQPQWIYIYDERNNSLLTSCNNAYSCTLNSDRVIVRNNQSSYRYYAQAMVNGSWITVYSPYISINGTTSGNNTYLNNVTVSATTNNRYTSNNVEYVTISASMTDTNYNNYSTDRRLQIVDTTNNVVLRDCGNSTYCDYTVSSGTYTSRTIVARVTINGYTKDSSAITVSYGNNNNNTSGDFRIEGYRSATNAVRLTAYAPSNLQWPPQRLEIYRTGISSPIGTCYGTQTCTMEHNTGSTGNFSFYAVFTLTDGTTRQSPTQTVYVN